MHINAKRKVESIWKMSINKRIFSCLIVLLLLILICLISYHQQDYIATMGKIEEGQKKIALTFDDGPHPYYTEQLLDGLKERGVKATFFVTGEHAKLHADIIKRMSEDGHLIGNHTYSHMQLGKTNREEFKEELVQTNEVIKGITGEEVIYVRPPYGSWDKELETELKKTADNSKDKRIISYDESLLFLEKYGCLKFFRILMPNISDTPVTISIQPEKSA